MTERQGTRIVYSFNASALEEAVGLLAALAEGRGRTSAGARRKARREEGAR